VVVGLAGLIALSWSYLVPTAVDMYGSMSGSSAWMMAATWDTRYFVLVFAMWCVMMVGMMVPSAAPMILLFAKAVQRSAQAEATVARTYAFAGGYLAAWAAFSLAATVLQSLLARAALMSPMMEYANTTIGALTLMAAGVYQWTPLKRRCLSHCRSPLQWLSHRWQPGIRGALRMGASHGVQCVGCCWALMLLLFFGGVMNLLWIALIGGFVLIEKLAPLGPHAGRIGGALLVASGVWLLVSSTA
jgi:predicted metal-binding membrane protein